MANDNLHINLPTTPFPMEGKMLEGKQKEILQQWQAMDIYRAMLEDRRDAQLFMLHDGPPFPSGEMNIGIGFNKILKDIVVKFWTMNGRKVHFVPGWDCHGLPIESDALDRAKKDNLIMSDLEIRERCASAVNGLIEKQKQQFQHLGVFADWDRPYLTMSAIYEASVLEVLSEIAKKGYVYRAKASINWCEQCQTVLADTEIEIIEHDRMCIRCGRTAESKEMLQWFIKLDHKEPGAEKTLRERALEELDQIRWIPQKSKIRIKNMIKERPDWRISRERVWGVPIPAIYCLDCDNDILDPEIITHVRDLVALEGSDVWFSSSITGILPKDFRCPKCQSTRLEKGSDILDGWFESGTSWRAALISDHRLDFPADLCIEGNDQHRGWFQLSILTSMMVKGRTPFTSILTHGFVLNSKRRRMSRLRGDYVSLRQALETIPVDLIRLYFVWNKNFEDDIPLSIPAMLELEPVYRIFRNCFRYLLGNLNDYQPREDSIPLIELERIDQWAICRLHRLINEITKLYGNFDLKTVLERLHDFCSDDLSKFYFEVVKDRLYNEPAKSYSRRKAQTVLHSVLVALIKILAPVLVYTTEEVWQLCPGHLDCASVHLSLWPKAIGGFMGQLTPGTRLVREGAREKLTELEEEFNIFLELRSALQTEFEKARSEKKIGDTIDATVTLCSSNSSGFSNAYLREHLCEIRETLNVSELRIVSRNKSLSPLPPIPGLFFNISRCSHPYCMRCRRYDKSVGSDATNPTYCQRCISALREQTSVELGRPMFSIDEKTPPYELSAYLRARDIRRVAILNNNGNFNTYYFHQPSQKVKPNSTLLPLADYIKNHADYKKHAAILLGLGEHTDILFGIGIHQLTYGTPLGGTREFNYNTVGEMIENLLRLSYGMSVKNAIGELPHGGGKSIIDTCGIDFKVHREFRRHVYRDFGQFTASLYGRYICAEDMNNTNADTREMLAFCRHVMCLPESVGGSGNPSRFTSHVGWLAAKAGWKFLTGKDSLDGVIVAIQGVGNVGSILIEILAEGEPGLKKILVADIVPEQIDKIRKKLQRKGKAHLLDIRNANDPGCNKTKRSETENEKTYILYSKCDILIPVAIGKVITPDNVDCLQCKVIVPLANNVYSENDKVARKLFEAGIVDVVENNVNWGGATVAASELYGYDEDNVIDWCLKKIYEETIDLLNEAKAKRLPPWKIIKLRASERMRQIHPVVKQARQYKFIGDVSEDFSKWIIEKWLPNKFSIDPDDFATKVVSISNQYLLEKA